MEEIRQISNQLKKISFQSSEDYLTDLMKPGSGLDQSLIKQLRIEIASLHLSSREFDKSYCELTQILNEEIEGIFPYNPKSRKSELSRNGLMHPKAAQTDQSVPSHDRRSHPEIERNC
jgi:hypothetical protein